MSYIPSFCFIRFEVRGRRADLEEFRTQQVSGLDPVLKGNWIVQELSEFSFNKVCPIDENTFGQSLLTLSTLRAGIWGCDSRAMGLTLKQEPHRLIYSFTVAATLPMPVLTKLIKINPHLKFDAIYENRQTGISGTILGRSGKLFHRQFDLYANESIA